MNRRSANTAMATAIATALALSLAACGGSDSKSSKSKSKQPSTAAQSRAIVSGTTTFTPDPTAIGRLKAAGVTVKPTAPGKATATTIVIPSNGGRIVVKSLIGSVHSAVGLTFAKGASKVTFENLAVNTESRKVTGSYKGNRIAVFQLRLMDMQAGKGAESAVVATGLKLVYARGAASIINTALKVNVLKAKQTFGKATFTVVAKKTGSSAADSSKKKKKKSTTTTTTSKNN